MDAACDGNRVKCGITGCDNLFGNYRIVITTVASLPRTALEYTNRSVRHFLPMLTSVSSPQQQTTSIHTPPQTPPHYARTGPIAALEVDEALALASVVVAHAAPCVACAWVRAFGCMCVGLAICVHPSMSDLEGRFDVIARNIVANAKVSSIHLLLLHPSIHPPTH